MRKVRAKYVVYARTSYSKHSTCIACSNCNLFTFGRCKRFYVQFVVVHTARTARTYHEVCSRSVFCSRQMDIVCAIFVFALGAISILSVYVVDL